MSKKSIPLIPASRFKRVKSNDPLKSEISKIVAKKHKAYTERYYNSNSSWSYVNHSCEIWSEDGEFLGVLLKGIIVDPNLLQAGRNLKVYANVTTLRPKLSGIRSYKNKKGENVKTGLPVRSGVLGYTEPMMYYKCKKTKSYIENEKRFDNETIHLIKYISKKYKKYVPKNYRHQENFIKKINQNMRIKGTVFTTLTVNKDFRTKTHRDSGDLESGLGNLIVFNESGRKTYKRGEFLLPEYKVAINIEEGDILFINVHKIHGNNPIIGKGRISLVCYVREKILEKCKDVTEYDLKYNYDRRYKSKRKSVSKTRKPKQIKITKHFTEQY